MPALLTTPSIEPKVCIAIEAISRAVAGSPMSPGTTASAVRRSEGGRCDVERVSDYVITTLYKGVGNAGANSLRRTGHDHGLAFCLHVFRQRGLYDLLVQERFPVGRHPSGRPGYGLTFRMRVRRKQFHTFHHSLRVVIVEPMLAGLKAGYDRMPRRRRML